MGANLDKRELERERDQEKDLERDQKHMRELSKIA